MEISAFLIAFALCVLTGCRSDYSDAKSTESSTLPMQEIKGRDEGEGRQSIYRVKVVDSWIRRDQLPGETLADTTKALCEFIILEGADAVRISIHNFPSATLEERVPPGAQIARWQRQFNQLETAESHVTPQAFSGYSGLLFTGVGLMEDKQTMVLGWVLQLAPEHYRTLAKSQSLENKQIRADVTIKAVGPKLLMEKHKSAIISFARSFELIREIPTRA